MLHRVRKDLIGSEATSVDVKLIKRVISPGNAAPFLNFTSKGLVDITQDVPLAGPLTKREVCVLGTRWGFPKSRHLRLRTLPDCLSTPR